MDPLTQRTGGSLQQIHYIAVFYSMPGTLHRVPAIIHALTHGTVRSPTHVREV